MFLDYYRLREQPFGVAPNPAYLYPSQTHREALAALSSGLEADRGFMALIAKPGMGKTTLLNQLLDKWRNSARTVFLFQTQCDSREFFRYVLSELGIDAEPMGLVTMHRKLNQVLFDQMLAGKRFVLAVDEAQNLNESVLETVRLLSNFETQHTKLLQSVLAGQPQLAEKLAQPRQWQLRQRIAVLSHLEPFTAAETAGYIDHRLKVAGYCGEPLFTPGALELIAQRSQGIPRNINNICHNSLSMAHARGRQKVNSDIVQGVVDHLDVESIARRSSAKPAPVANPVAASPSRPVDRLRRQPSPLLTYKPHVQLSWARRIFGAAALASILTLGGWYVFSSFPNFAKSGQAVTGSASSKDSQTVSAPIGPNHSAEVLPTSYAADPQDSGSGQVLTVIARPGQTLQEISLVYVGHFDPSLSQEISTLNPELTDPNHLEAGQLIRLPLPPGTLRKAGDTSEVVTASQGESSKTLFAKVRALLGAKRW
jgi:type II secretory pathway predicted ATPase ExeA